METCYRHPSRETGVACSNCGRPICPECMTPTPVGMRCPECSRQRTRVMTSRSMYAQPTATYALIAINVIVFLAELVSGVSASSGINGTSDLIRHGALSRATVANGDYWQLVTSGFLHATIFHIAFNMYALYILGLMLEPMVGHMRFLLIYFVSLLAGSFGALLLTPHGFTVGASGAVFGLMGAAILEMRNRGIDPMQSGLPFWLGINLIFSFTISGISVGGHIGGLVGGGLAAIALFQVGKRRTIPAPVGPLLACALGVVAVVGAIVVAHSGAA
ncbi:MAG TPA: rhomboid family intramembrane serine protease [Thermoleophilaceae bacterium]|nr:rhomboid family intramembrane serine protease [Thermoleophilaceae bacterium]